MFTLDESFSEIFLGRNLWALLARISRTQVLPDKQEPLAKHPMCMPMHEHIHASPQAKEVLEAEGSIRICLWDVRRADC